MAIDMGRTKKVKVRTEVQKDGTNHFQAYHQWKKGQVCLFNDASWMYDRSDAGYTLSSQKGATEDDDEDPDERKWD